MRNWLKKFRRPTIREWFGKQKKVYAAVPKPQDPNKLAKGKLLYVEGLADPVRVERVTGNIANPTKFEVNGSYLISMLDFYTQMIEGRRPTDEEREEWDSIELLEVEAPERKPARRRERDN